MNDISSSHRITFHIYSFYNYLSGSSFYNYSSGRGFVILEQEGSVPPLDVYFDSSGEGALARQYELLCRKALGQVYNLLEQNTYSARFILL